MAKSKDPSIQIGVEILNLLGKVVDATLSVSNEIKSLKSDLNKNIYAFGLGATLGGLNPFQIKEQTLKDNVKKEQPITNFKLDKEVKEIPKEVKTELKSPPYNEKVIGVMGMQLGNTKEEEKKLKTILKENDKSGTIKKPFVPKTSEEDYEEYQQNLKNKRQRKGELDFSFLTDAFKGFKNKFKKEVKEEEKKSIRDIIMEKSYPEKKEEKKTFKQNRREKQEPSALDNFLGSAGRVGLGVGIGSKLAMDYFAPGESGTFSNIEGYNRQMQQSTDSPTSMMSWAKYLGGLMEGITFSPIVDGINGIMKGVS